MADLPRIQLEALNETLKGCKSTKEAEAIMCQYVIDGMVDDYLELAFKFVNNG